MYLRDVCQSHSVDRLPDLLSARVAVTTQLEPERPVGGHHRPSDDVGVLLDHVLRLGAEEHEKVERAADGAIG